MRLSRWLPIVLTAGLVLAASVRAEDPALEAYARGDYPAVVARITPEYEAGTASIQHRLLLVRAMLHLDTPDDARAVLQSVLDSDRENPEANHLTGQILLQGGQNEEALKYLKQAYRLKKDAATAAALGRCHYGLGDLAKAKPLLEEALAEDIRNPDNSLLLGRICLKRGLGALAERYLLAAEEAGMDTLDLRLRLGQAYLMQRKFTGPVLVRRLVPKPAGGDIVDGEVVLGAVHGSPDHYRVATRYCALYEGLRILARSPKHPEGLYLAARGWFAAGRPELGNGYRVELAKLEPGSRRVLELEIEWLIDNASLETLLASEAVKKAFSPAEIAKVHYRRGLRARAEGERKAALGALQKAERLAPTSGEVLRALAELTRAMGRRDAARGYYARLVELFPDAADIHELRNTLKVLREERGQS